ncbi:MAG: outer membrane lipoprotein chaperone LolA [Steroidobacteraceae bacterium]
MRRGNLVRIASSALGACAAVLMISAALAAPTVSKGREGPRAQSGELTSDATGAAPLTRFLDGLRSFRAGFSQTVTGAHGHIVQQATGELIVLRPGKFRWVTRPAGVSAAGRPSGREQLLVADGRNLWSYDKELEQVVVRPESAALTATPAMLLSGGPQALSAFGISGAGKRDGLEWVRVAPKAADADFKEALLGFSGGDLERMILEDKLGETVNLTFEHAERNVPVAASQMSFTPPAGADVIGTPQK